MTRVAACVRCRKSVFETYLVEPEGWVCVPCLEQLLAEARQARAHWHHSWQTVSELLDIRTAACQEAQEERCAIAARLAEYAANDRPRLALWEERARHLGRDLEQAKHEMRLLVDYVSDLARSEPRAANAEDVVRSLRKRLPWLTQTKEQP